MAATEQELIKVTANSPSQSYAAKALGISPAAISQRLSRNPELKQKVLDIREQAIKKSGLSLVKAFQRVDEALDAKNGKKADHDIRLKAAKQTAEIYHVTQDKDDGQGPLSRPMVVMPIVVINGTPLSFDVGG